MRQHDSGGCGECRVVLGCHHDAPFAVLVFLAAHHHVLVRAVHIPGVSNVAVDALME